MIIKCPECEKDVSDKATACQYCGFPIESFIKKAKYDAKAAELKTRLKEKAPDFGRRLLKNIGKLALLAAVLFGIGLIKAYIIGTDDFLSPGYTNTALAHNILTNILWWTILGLSCKFWGKRPMRPLWFIFMLISTIGQICNLLIVLLPPDLEMAILHMFLVLFPWIGLAVHFYEPSRKYKKPSHPNPQS